MSITDAEIQKVVPKNSNGHPALKIKQEEVVKCSKQA